VLLLFCGLGFHRVILSSGLGDDPSGFFVFQVFRGEGLRFPGLRSETWGTRSHAHSSR
jgi:hypothetical protein